MSRPLAGPTPTPLAGIEVAAAGLVAGLTARPCGQISPSVYETGRLVTLAPWLAGHGRRVEFLFTAQRPDGAWGGPDGYALAPTLSATEALLTTMRRDPGHPAHPRRTAAVDRALRWLRARPSLALPDTPAVEIIVPALVTLLNQHLAGPPPGLEHWRADALVPLPAGTDHRPLTKLRAALLGGGPVPEKVLHSLEVAGDAAHRARAVRPLPLGTIGASPAATAAWLGERRPHDADGAVRYLETVARQHGGPVPSVVPITVFERTWVLSTLAAAGIKAKPPRHMVAAIGAGLGPAGTPGGVGLPPDADTTAVALLTLAYHGAPTDPRCLLGYETATHFCTWHGERTPSTSTNAHVLEALAGYPTGVADAAAGKISAWLCGQQRPDGSWLDKWHASPYYATACCALALDRVDRLGRLSRVSRVSRSDGAAAVRRAVAWVLETQRPDGSWGRWDGTAEETAYALRVLLTVRPAVAGAPAEEAAARGYRYLLASMRHGADPPLWHDKDLYLPTAVVRAAVLGAVHLAQHRPGVMARPARRVG